MSMTVRTQAVLASVAFAAGVWFFWPNPVPESRAVIAQPAPAVANMAKVHTPIKSPTVKAYPARAKRALKLPAVIANDPAKAVLDSTRVQADSRDTLITTLIDTETGEPLTLTEKQPLPWLAVGGRQSIWLGAGYKNGRAVMRAEGEVALLAIKEWQVSGRATVDVPMGAPGQLDTFVGMGVGRGW